MLHHHLLFGKSLSFASILPLLWTNFRYLSGIGLKGPHSAQLHPRPYASHESGQNHLRYGNCFTLGQFGDGVGQVDILDIIGTGGHP